MFIARFYRKQALAVLAFLLVTALSGDLLAQTKPKRSDVGGEPASAFLWAGNSFFYYNNSMHNHVGNLAKVADPKTRFRGTSVTISGSGFDWHDMESYFRPERHRQVLIRRRQ